MFATRIVRRCLRFALAASVSLAAASAQQFVFTPTTTLTAETANNTSAADSFTALSNGDAAAGNVSKLPLTSLLYPGATTAIYAHFQPWYGQSNHLNVGYDSDDAGQVTSQVTDMISRGISGAIVDWYGPDLTVENNTTLLLKTEAESRSGFSFAVMEDVGALNKCAKTAGCDITQQLISDLTYAYNTFCGSPAYLTVNGHPLLFFYGVDEYTINWQLVGSSVPTTPSGSPYFIFNGSSNFTHTLSDGFFDWISVNKSNPADEGLTALSSFYSGSLGLTGDLIYGAAYSGFNESLAPWVTTTPRIMNQNCGQTWLDTFSTAGKYYSNSKQLASLGVVTWNDYEEATEIESGIDNCIALTPMITGSTLSWSVTGNEKAVSDYRVFVSLDGNQLMRLADVAVGTHSLVLLPFNLLAGTNYELFVEAIGVASVRNHFSAATAYQPANRPPVAVLTVMPSSGPAPLMVNASTAGSSDPDGTVASSSINFGDGSPVVSGPTASHTYTTPGTFTVTATVTDNLGANSMTTQQVKVSPATPVAVLTVTSLSSSVVSASTVGSFSPDATIVSSTINFGDGTATVSGPTAAHIYQSAGTFTVTATVTDSLGAIVSTTQMATISQGCAISKTNRTVTICAPANNSTVSSPVTVVAQATDSSTVSYTQIYVDGTKAYQVTGSSLNTSLTLATGTHTVTVQSADKSGSFKSTVKISVGSSGSGGGGGGATPTVIIFSPANGATVTSPVTVTANASDSKPVTYMQIYVDGSNVYQVNKIAQLNTTVKMSKGSHRLTVQASDGTTVFKTTITITVH